MTSRLGLTTVSIFLSLFLLTGCADAVLMSARWVNELSSVQQAGFDRREEIYTFRSWIRTKCKASLERSAFVLEVKGDEKGLRELLAKHYPGLILPTLVKQSENIGETAPECSSREK